MSAKAADYTIVSEHDLYVLISKVCELLKQGYEPLGGVQVVPPVSRDLEATSVYLQTMILKK